MASGTRRSAGGVGWGGKLPSVRESSRAGKRGGRLARLRPIPPPARRSRDNGHAPRGHLSPTGRGRRRAKRGSRVRAFGSIERSVPLSPYPSPPPTSDISDFGGLISAELG